ncbi:GNAT family N-acetyltransferase [Brucella sp. NM4]|uniref:GNAT family N-acetyltransferase n=1 Tax=Brucella/Ochrobactrum group TaxID=2826938 RepID=UPI0024BC2A0F|nr:GNAT family N-acetyltransferase [Brucella sp. NM4]WHS31136.1 GNAT family N-acetyltransferase [Brucella sp. NM4]WHT42414.1 GNAT family N-acetyltransferase [Ochrobactrum sp. SSR]
MNDEDPHSEESFVLRIVENINEFTEDEWSSLAGASRQDANYNPFTTRAFLSALEESGSVSRKAGWLPRHLRLENNRGELLGAVPNYLKGHSQGEYVFDHGWADAFERAGGRYYPKFQAAIPFTPATGPRLLNHIAYDGEAVRLALAGGLRELTDQAGVSSAHVTFALPDEIKALERAGFLHRTDQQFHFINNGFSNYDDFLSELVSRKRKALKKERREALSDGIEIVWLTGSDLTEAVWDDFFAFYMDTGSRKWGRPYLNREFYSLIGQTMAEDILLVMAKRAGRYIAGAINFIGGDRLFGRHWGCIEDHPYLHFEVCYHQAIDFAIERKLRVVEAGAQGEHKLARGYVPVTTHSAHYIVNESFRNAVSDYLVQERHEVEQIHEALEEHTPYRHEAAPTKLA